MELWKLGATASLELMREGAVSSRELVDSVLDRVEAVNPTLNAIVARRDAQARADADAADAARAAGQDLGPLHGVPVTIKENIDVEGEATTNGIPAFAEMIATDDAPLVARLREAGAILIGRTNTPEFSMRATTDNPLRGRTINPWGDQISPGGSSGGAGAACAAGMGPLHHGNDIGGSLRFPSFANGVMTIKPTSYRVPVWNSTATAERGPLSQEMSVQGIIARHAEDIRLATSVMIQPDPRDPLSPPIPWDGPPVENRTVAVARETDGYPLHEDIAELLDDAVAKLTDAGYNVVDVEPPPISEPARNWFRTLTTEMRIMLDTALRTHGSDTIVQIFDWYFELSELLELPEFVAASGHRTAMKREWSLFLDEHPLVLTPFMMRPMIDWNDDATGLDAVADLFAASIYSTGVNELGLPAGVIGTGFAGGRPAAVQIVGRRWREDLIGNALHALEERTPSLPAQLWDQMA